MNWLFDDPSLVVTVVVFLLSLTSVVWAGLMALKRRRIKRRLIAELDRIFNELYND